MVLHQSEAEKLHEGYQTSNLGENLKKLVRVLSVGNENVSGSELIP